MDEEIGIERDAQKWGMFCHLAGLMGLVSCTCIPVAGLVVPLIIWLVKREDHPYIDSQGKEAVNFQLSMTIYGFGLAILLAVIHIVPFLGPLIAFIVWTAFCLADLVLIIIAAMAANDGKDYQYPFNLRLL